MSQEQKQTKTVCAICGKYISLSIFKAIFQHYTCWFKEVLMTKEELGDN